ncbi:uncharacterized protein LOC141595859 [Silene latifolia]|uniref:uncharacterized protein LOC141595859 n=1 Tax=Silene latifolia TaxID=37657 RepID=UPI003D76C848
MDYSDRDYNRLVVRSTNSEAGGCKQMDFHLVDLKKNTITMECFPSLPNGIGIGNMLYLRRKILIIGGDFGSLDLLPNKTSENHPDPDSIHLGASLYSIVHNHWKAMRLPTNLAMSNPAIVLGRLYCFGSPYLLPEVCAYGGIWKKLELPTELRGRYASAPVVTDYDKSRVLVQVCDLNELYAFCPPPNKDNDNFSPVSSSSGTWSRIATNISIWCDVVAVADDIIYFHEWDFKNLLLAYDLRSNKWVDVVADLSRVVITVREFDKLFTLPNGFMCLAAWVPLRPLVNKDPPSVQFLRFRVQRSPDSDPLIIKLTAIDYQSYSIPSAETVCDFIMLEEDDYVYKSKSNGVV